jgi:hypothetical protein
VTPAIPPPITTTSDALGSGFIHLPPARDKEPIPDRFALVV